VEEIDSEHRRGEREDERGSGKTAGVEDARSGGVTATTAWVKPAMNSYWKNQSPGRRRIQVVVRLLTRAPRSAAVERGGELSGVAGFGCQIGSKWRFKTP
jgi:hypothetical protein